MHFARATSLLIFGISLSLATAQPVHAGDAYKWSVQYLIDTSRSIFGRTQKVSPRHNRGLAISPDSKFLYAGYHHSLGGSGEVRRIELETADYERATVAILPGVLGKSIAIDSAGRVYIANEFQILVYDASLQKRLLVIPCGMCEGLATAKDGNDFVLYSTDREEATIRRWIIAGNGGDLTATLKGFGGEGVLKIPGALDLRGVAVDAKGRLWCADLKGNKVFKVDADGQNLSSVAVNTPMAIAFDNGRAFVTRYTERAISVIDENLAVIGNLSVPWEELELSPFGNNKQGALSGIVAIPGKGLLIANEGGQTADQKSTYGRADDRSDFVGGKLYRDRLQDDNEPILRATEVTTAP